jgi:hypothetical protein
MPCITIGQAGEAEDLSDTAIKINIGAIVTEALAISRRNLGAFGVVALALTAAPQLVLGLIQMRAGASETAQIAGIAAIPVSIASVFAQAGIMFGALEDLRGRRLSTGEVFAAGCKYFGRVFVVSLVVGLGIVFASILLFVPGLILATMWSVAPVVAITRDKGLGFTLRESSAATKGNRWRILGLLAIFFVVIVVIYLLGGALGAAGPLFLAVAQAIVAPVQTVIGATGVVALYSALDRNRGGLNSAALASTFD